ncbi:tyrosine-type recombinase/integrase [Tunturiibacter lichenicola]|uniref:tyrosine-type recombinase/integrase n=1 Tax=Tunturiibacter lichenicola TaxID=2051959 RepID=UPI003D9B4057
MTTTPTITIYVRHSAGCKYEGDEFAKRCDCRKWLRWTQHGTRHRLKANTRSWAEAEQVKRDLEDQLTGKTVVSETTGTRNIRSAIEVFITDKKVENLTADLIRKYERELGRLASYCEARAVFTLGGINREIITGFCSDWHERYPSSLTRNRLAERYKSFLKLCRLAGWLVEIPQWPKMKAEQTPTLPLTAEEYRRLLDAVYVVVRSPQDAVVKNQSHEYWCQRVHGLFQLMRHSGLSIQDALTLPRSALVKSATGYRVVTQRTKTGTDVSVLLPTDVAAELLAVPNDNDKYLFWSGVGAPKSICGNWGKRFVAPCFTEAKIDDNGHMKSHRLRDTFACELLKAGVSLEHVSKLLGHRSIRTTEQSYAAWVPSRQEVLDKAVVSAWVTPATRKARLGSTRSTPSVYP